MTQYVSLEEDSSDAESWRPTAPVHAPQLRVHAPQLQLHADKKQTSSGSGAAVAAPPAGGLKFPPAFDELSSSETQSSDETRMTERVDEAPKKERADDGAPLKKLWSRQCGGPTPKFQAKPKSKFLRMQAKRNYGDGSLHAAWTAKRFRPKLHYNENQMDRPEASSSSAVAVTCTHSIRQYRCGFVKEETAQRRLVRLETALGDRGPDTSLEPFNPQTDQKNTINLIVAQFVVFQDVHINQFKRMLYDHPASILVVLFDLMGEPSRFAEVIDDVVQTSQHWECNTLGVCGKVLYRPCRIQTVRFLARVSIAGESSVLQTMRVVLKGNGFNPCTAVAVGVMIPELESATPWPPYSPAFLQMIKTTLLLQQVRILMGVFTGYTTQVSDIGKSCGAIGGRPFCQMFLIDQAPLACAPEVAKQFDIRPFNGGNYVTHPAYIMVFGPCSKTAHAPTDAAPVLPPWLFGVTPWSNLVCSLRGIPSWDVIPLWMEDHRIRSGGDPQLDLGNAKQKQTNMGRWIPRVHQLMVYVGTSRTGQGAKRRQATLNQRATAKWTSKTPGQWFRYPQ